MIKTFAAHPSVQSIGLRVLTTVGRFSLIYFLGNQLTLDEIGFFSIIQAAVGYATGTCGFEYHAYMNRRIIGVPLKEQRFQLGNTLVAVLPSIALTVIILTLFLTFLPSMRASESYQGFLPFFLIGLFVFVAEYIGTELYRLFVSIGHPVRANVHLFIRNGLWPLLLIALAPFVAMNNVWSLVFIWWIATTLSLFVFISYMRRHGITPSFSQIDWAWINEGFRVSLPLWVGSLFGRSNVVLDRVILSAISLADVGIYSLWMACGLMIQVFFEAGFSSIALSHLLRARETAPERVLPIYYRFVKVSMVALFLVTATVLLLFPFIPALIGKPELIEYRAEFYLIIIGNAVIAASNISALYMFSQRLDRPFWMINMSSTFVLLAFAIPLTHHYQLFGMALAFFFLSLFFLMARTVTVLRAIRRRPSV